MFNESNSDGTACWLLTMKYVLNLDAALFEVIKKLGESVCPAELKPQSGLLKTMFFISELLIASRVISAWCLVKVGDTLQCITTFHSKLQLPNFALEKANWAHTVYFNTYGNFLLRPAESNLSLHRTVASRSGLSVTVRNSLLYNSSYLNFVSIHLISICYTHF